MRDGSAVWWCGRESIFKICHTNEFCGKSKLARETARASGRLGEPRRTYKRETAPGGAQGELQGRQSQVGRGGSVLVLFVVSFRCLHSLVRLDGRPAGQAESHTDTHQSWAHAFRGRSRDRSRALISILFNWWKWLSQQKIINYNVIIELLTDSVRV